MKWGIVVLLVLGLIAAFCAAVLVGFLKLGTFGQEDVKTSESEMVEVLVATRDLPTLTVITADCFVTKKIPRAEVPKNDRPFNVTETLGSVNIQAIVEGQILTESCFGWGGTGPEIIAKLAPGMFAYTIHMSRTSLPDLTFLYPGCVVDVLHTTRLDRSLGGHTISRTLLERGRVMAVSGRTQMAAANPETKQSGSSSRNTRGTVAVTLEVNRRQAQGLGLAKGSGSMYLVVRNPSDITKGDEESMMLVEGQLARYTPADLANDPNRSSMNPQDPNDRSPRTPIFSPYRPGQDKNREVIIHRGIKTERKEVEAPKGEDPNETTEQK